MVRRTRRPCPVLTLECSATSRQGSFLQAAYSFGEE
jgi:hypothetical protein